MIGDTIEQLVAIRELIALYPQPVSPVRPEHHELEAAQRVAVRGDRAYLTCADYEAGQRAARRQGRRKQAPPGPSALLAEDVVEGHIRASAPELGGRPLTRRGPR